MKKIMMIMIAAVSLLTACDGDENLERSIWISDPDDSGLPKYTEWGYNTFGAQMGRTYFVSCWKETPCTMEWHDTDSTLEFTMNGCIAYQNDLSRSGYMYYKDNDMSLTMIFPFDSVIDSNKKLYLLDGKDIDLTASGVKVLVKQNDNPMGEVTDIRDGKLCFKRVQMLYIDEKFEEAIVSGTFEIRYVKDGEKTRMSDGRFDFGITPNFFW